MELTDHIERTAWPVRAIGPNVGVELTRAADGEGVVTKHFAVFNQWAEIRSVFEGTFMERIAQGRFRRDLQGTAEQDKVLFQHGRDPLIGDKILGSITKLEEDSRGAAYEVSLVDTSYVRELVPALDRGLYGASFRFRPLKMEVVEDAEASEHNPNGLPEVTVTEAQVSEFGPVTFPAYSGASAGSRSLTDELLFTSLSHSDRLAQLADYAERTEREEARTSSPPSHPRALLTSSRGLWGCEDSPLQPLPLPDWYYERSRQPREQPPHPYGHIERH